jgi:tetratricopeptide (TPR) repeat protein
MNSAQNDPSNDLARFQRSPQAIMSFQNAQQHARSGRHAAALASYRILSEQFPGVAVVWAELATAAMSELDFELAEQAYDRAAELASKDPDMLVAVGTQYYHLRRLDKAFECLTKAVAVNPASLNARLTLASWYERTRRLDEAWECVEACLAVHPKEGRMIYFKAFLLQCKGRHEEAVALAADLLQKDLALPLDVQSNCNHLMAVSLDALGQYKEAFTALGRAKVLRRKITNVAVMEQTYDRMDQARRQLLAELTPDTVRRWRDEAAASPCPHPLALVAGSPRSGTTLLEQILAVNQGIFVFDEPHSFAAELLKPFNQPPPAKPVTLKNLNDLTPEARAQLIGRYFKSLLREAHEPTGDRLLLDKNPSTTGGLYIWLRLFPQSKIVIALRDPRDVIISCYFQNITVNWANVAFLNLERTAKYYANCMDVWLRFRDLGGFEWTEVRYEDVVANLEQEGRRVTGFLGLEWTDAQTKFHESARSKFVHSPTYNEVTKPLYKKSVRRWEHYAEAVTPFQAGLEPYLRAFRYSIT